MLFANSLSTAFIVSTVDRSSKHVGLASAMTSMRYQSSVIVARRISSRLSIRIGQTVSPGMNEANGR
jgi:hypothetical protein